MIHPNRPQTTGAVAAHYDELDPFYREVWGEHVHHGYWPSGRESPAEAADALVRLVADRLDLEPGQAVCDIGCGYGATAADLVARHGRLGLGVGAKVALVASLAETGGAAIAGAAPALAWTSDRPGVVTVRDGTVEAVRAARAEHSVERTGSQHEKARDRAAVQYHYDIGNDFYQLWLDRRMVYSCAYFETPDTPLDEAQLAKLEHICRKLRLRPGERLLDVGCGWGATMLRAIASPISTAMNSASTDAIAMRRYMLDSAFSNRS